MKYLTGTIWMLGLVSLFTDMASEMLYPVMPLYLQSIAIPIYFIGLLEGFAEGFAGLTKSYFGKLSDLSGKRLPFVRLGYTISAFAKPLFIVFKNPYWILLVRSSDRLGKGIRGAARDAMLSDASAPEHRASVFGFHRTMDTIGAFIGPLLALLWLYYYPNDYQSLFLFCFIPGILAVACTFLLKENASNTAVSKSYFSIKNTYAYWKESTAEYRKLIIGFITFTLINSSDVFLLLKIKDAGFDATFVISMYIFYNFVYAIAAYPFGLWADKLGTKKIYLIGLMFFALTYTGMAFNTSVWGYVLLFISYGFYAAATEGVSKAWITRIVPKTESASALGTFAALQSIALFCASTIAGIIWYTFQPEYVFYCSALGIVPVLLFFYFKIKESGTV